MAEAWRWAAVLSSRVLDDATARVALDALGSEVPPSDVLYEQLAKAKVVRDADRRLTAWTDVPASLSSVRDRLRTVVAEDDEWREVALPPMVAAVRHAAKAGASVMKGLVLSTLYDDPLSRHVGDVDLHCADWGTALDVCRALVADGWVWDTTEPPWLKWDTAGPYGQLSLVSPDNVDPVARVDLHVGPYSVGPNGRVAMPEPVTGEVLGVPVRVTDATTLGVILVAHALNDGFSSMKDLNDLAMLIRSGRCDLAAVRSACAGFGGTGALDQLLTTARALDALAAAPTRIELIGRAVERGPLMLRPPRGRVRALRAGWFAYRVGRIDGSSLPDAARTGWQSYRYYSADLSPRTGDPGTVLEPAWRRPDVCWRLLPAEAWPNPEPAATNRGAVTREQLADGIVRHVSGHAVAITLDSQVFVPTVWGQIAPESVALATSLARGGDRQAPADD